MYPLFNPCMNIYYWETMLYLQRNVTTHHFVGCCPTGSSRLDNKVMTFFKQLDCSKPKIVTSTNTSID